MQNYSKQGYESKPFWFNNSCIFTVSSMSLMFHSYSAGDEVLSWNGQNLQGKDFNEVYTVIFESKSEPQVELYVARPMG